jgi:hypothetical protein
MVGKRRIEILVLMVIVGDQFFWYESRATSALAFGFAVSNVLG